MRIQHLIEVSRQREIAELKPDTIVRVFHGTDMDQTISFVEEGIDARKQVSRHYPHFIGQKKQIVSRGLFISAGIKTALDFGRVVVKFPVVGKDLYFRFPSPDIIRRERSFAINHYPKSFRPEVSYDLLHSSREPQALFRGLVSPRAIEQVYLANYDHEGNYVQGRIGEYKSSFTREEFIEWYYDVYQGMGGKSVQKRQPTKPLVEPQERITFEDLLQRIQQKYGKFDLDRDYIIDLIRDAVSQGDSYEQQIYRLSNFGGSNTLTYSVAKQLLPGILKTLNIPKMPGTKESPQRYWG